MAGVGEVSTLLSRREQNTTGVTTVTGNDQCLAFVDPPCSNPARKHNLCIAHKDGYEGTNWTRQEFVDYAGHPHSYIALDTVPPPMLIQPKDIVRFIRFHEPTAGKCPCCHDPFGTDTGAFVLHTAWRPRGDVSSVCRQCASPGHKHGKADDEPKSEDL
jgi:hypothetical protein